MLLIVSIQESENILVNEHLLRLELLQQPTEQEAEESSMANDISSSPLKQLNPEAVTDHAGPYSKKGTSDSSRKKSTC